MTALVPVAASRLSGANLAAVMTTATGTDTFPAGPNTWLRCKSANAGTVTVTVTPIAGSGPQGTTIAPLVLAPVVEATPGDRLYGPFPQNPFGDGSGNVNISEAPSSSVTVGAFIFPGA